MGDSVHSRYSLVKSKGESAGSFNRVSERINERCGFAPRQLVTGVSIAVAVVITLEVQLVPCENRVLVTVLGRNGMSIRGFSYRQRHVGAPCVLFLDDARWATFHQLSAQLRRAGVRTIRVTTLTTATAHVTSRLTFDRFFISSPTELVDLLRRIAREENIIDVQFVETFADVMSEVVDELPLEVAARVRPRLVVMDKWEVAHRFRAAGVRTPDVIALADVTPDEIADRLGFPVVVKEKIGCAGNSVSVCDDFESLRAVRQKYEEHLSDTYYERFITGEKLNYAAAVSRDGVEQDIGYRVTRWLLPVGTATQVRTMGDDALRDFGRRAVAVAGCQGLMNIDVIRDDQGVDWMIDFNARAFGGAANFLVADLDLSQGYLRSLGIRDVGPDTRVARDDCDVDIFPTCLNESVASGSYLIAARAFAASAAPYAKWLGVRYVLGEALGALMSTRKSRRSR